MITPDKHSKAVVTATVVQLQMVIIKGLGAAAPAFKRALANVALRHTTVMLPNYSHWHYPQQLDFDSRIRYEKAMANFAFVTSAADFEVNGLVS